jgi:hypothetical protein
MIFTIMRFKDMTTRKGMKLIIIGAVVLTIMTMTVSADESNETTPEIRTVSVDNPDECIITPNQEIIDHDTSEGERDDIEIEPYSENEELIIAPNPEDANLIAPSPDTNGEVFILDTGNQMPLDSESKTSLPIFSFPLVLVCVSLGLIGCIYLYGKRQG